MAFNLFERLETIGVAKAKTNAKTDDGRRKMVLESIIEGRRMEAYSEHRTKDMHACWICEKVCYRKTPAKNIGNKWICIDCLRKLKETLDNLGQWEEELALESEMKSQLEDGFNK